MKNTELISIGTIIGTHGIRGILKIRLDLEDVGLFHIFDKITDESGKIQYDIKLKSLHKGNFLAEMPNITNREDAKALCGTKLWVRKDELPEIEEDDSFYYDGLIGLKAYNPEGEAVGKVISVVDYGAGDLVEIKPDAGGEAILLPFSKEWFPDIDIDGGKITVIMPVMIDSKDE